MSEGESTELTGDLAWWARLLPPALEWVRVNGFEGELAEELARVDPDFDRDPQEAQWEAYENLRRRNAPSAEEHRARVGVQEWERDFEAIEVSMSPETIMDDWAETLAGIAEMRSDEHALRMIDEAEKLAVEYRGYAPQILDRALFRLEQLREERTEALSREAGRE